MNLRKNLENLLKGKNKDENSSKTSSLNNKNLVYTCVGIFILAVAICFFVWTIRNINKRNIAEIERQASEQASLALEASLASYAAAESAAAVELQKNDAKRDYEKLYTEYETALDACNEAIKEYNSFLADIEPFSVEGLPESMDLESSTWPSFEEYYGVGADHSVLVKQVEEVVQKSVEAEQVCKNASLIAYNVAVNDYNTVLDAYLEQSQKVALDFLEGVRTDQKRKQTLSKWIRDKWNRADAVSRIRYVIKETQELAALYVIALQLENPSEEWVRERLIKIDDIVMILYNKSWHFIHKSFKV